MITREAHTRFWQKQENKNPRKPGRPKRTKTASNVVIFFDTETTTDPSQRLNFGVYEIGELKGSEIEILERGIFHTEDLRDRDPNGFETLAEWAEENDSSFGPRSDFWHHVMVRLGYETQAQIVGFNLPFDLGALALGWGEARGRNKGGFSLWFDSYRGDENKYSPRIIIKHRSTTSAFIRFSSPRNRKKDLGGPGRFVDLRTVTFALSNAKHSLRSAAEAWGLAIQKAGTDSHGTISTEYIEYAVQDVAVTRQLFVAVQQELDALPVDIEMHRIHSPATLGKGFLDSAGVIPPLQKFQLPDSAYAVAMESFYGGRSEVRIRHQETPIAYVDFLSMYPTVNALMRMWDVLTAREVRWVPATEEIRTLLNDISIEDLFDREMWPRLRFFARIHPDGDILPLRAKYDGSTTRIGHNVVTSDIPLAYSGPDLVASTVLTGSPPEVVEAWILEPVGRQEGLTSVVLSNGREIDPRGQDVFKALIEQRKQLDPEDPQSERLSSFLKAVANSAGYGIFAEFNRQADRGEVSIAGLESFEVDAFPETPGRFCFPPTAALITAAARLMLAMLEVEVRRRGGSHVFCDTDSMAITLADGGLSWDDIQQIVRRFEQLKPYDPDWVTDPILEIEEVHRRGEHLEAVTALAISAKRYAIFSLDQSDGRDP